MGKFDVEGLFPQEAELTPEAREAYEKFQDSVVNRPENFATDKEYAVQFIENVRAEKHWYDGTKFILQELKNDGVEFSIENKDILEMYKVSGDLFKIRYYRQLIHATGLSQFEDRIMAHLIDKFFHSGNPFTKPPIPPAGPKT